MVYLLVLFWIICGVASYGLMFAFFQRKYKSLAEEDYKKDRLEFFLLSLSGPINLIAVLYIIYNYGFYGFKFR